MHCVLCAGWGSRADSARPKCGWFKRVTYDATVAKAPRADHDAIESIARASFDELKSSHPDEWQRTGNALLAALRRDKVAGAAAFLKELAAEAAPWRERLARGERVEAQALPVLVRARLGELAVKRAASAALGKRGLRIGLWSGLIAQRLFFSRGLVRKAVSLRWFRLFWPLVTKKSALLPTLAGRGVYCFYSDALVIQLAALIGDAPTIEIAAGDGTLARLLRAAGRDVRATDDHSWRHVIDFPDEVERLDARTALARYSPKVVLCSWPPPGNDFEAAVFATASVERYIVITTRQRFAAGNWDAYDDAKDFDRREDAALSSLVLPPEVEPLVIVWSRR